MLVVKRAQIGNYSFAENPINISVKDNPNHLMSPTWNMVSALKNNDNDYSRDDYTDDYELLIQKRLMKRGFDVLNDLVEPGRHKTDIITLCCYCQSSQFCHAGLAVGIILDYCRHIGIEAKYEGFIK